VAEPTRPLKVLIAVIENRDSVPIPFWGSCESIRPLPGMRVEEKQFTSSDIVAMRSDAAEHALEYGHDRVLMLDTDMVYRPETLALLEGAGVDVICGFSVNRTMPYQPNWFIEPAKQNGDPYSFERAWPTDTGDADGERLHGPQRVHVVGGAALYIRTSVFRKIARPWFEFRWYDLPDGKRVRVGEDVWFSHQCRLAGVELHCHADLLVGHLVTMPVVPEHEEERGWRVKFVPPMSRDAMKAHEEARARHSVLDTEAAAHRQAMKDIEAMFAKISENPNGTDVPGVLDAEAEANNRDRSEIREMLAVVPTPETSVTALPIRPIRPIRSILPIPEGPLSLLEN